MKFLSLRVMAALMAMLMLLSVALVACDKTPDTPTDTTDNAKEETTVNDTVTEAPTQPAETEPPFSDEDVVKAEREQLSFKPSSQSSLCSGEVIRHSVVHMLTSSTPHSSSVFLTSSRSRFCHLYVSTAS